MTENPWRCAGCGVEGVERQCDCATNVVFRKGDNGMNVFARKLAAPELLAPTLRAALPERRPSLTHTFEHASAPGAKAFTYTLTVGFYDRTFRRPGEIFLSTAKTGTDAEVNARDGSIAISIAMQYGVPLDVLRHAMTRNPDGSPSGPLGAALEELAGILKGTADDSGNAA